MQVEIGKIIEFDGYVGNILSLSNENYLFLSKDLKEEYEDLKGKVIIFRKESNRIRNRAFYIRSLENVLKNKQIRGKILEKVYKITDN